ncbi:MAG TPA: FMN-binding protein [Candidatus Saccharimonadales bacterium]|nr:FMN-binding protein [Candidatus Saccharimonadales bacterium]
MMKKFLLSFGVILAFAGYSVHEKNETASIHVTPNTSSATPTTSGGITTTNAPSSNTPIGAYKDGTYTGDVADAYYGNIQVKATIQNSKISDVVFLQYPNDRGESVEINTQAMPMLKQEAITAQKAQVDVVSGATDSSQAFVQSLQSALDKAKNG